MQKDALTGHRQGPACSRLREVKLDPLEEFGLPSKGDKRLLSFKTQEEYYDRIQLRYNQIYQTDRQDHPLRTALATLSLEHGEHQRRAITTPGRDHERELAILLAAMRKLREAIVASARNDAFVIDVYVFIIRATILSGHRESYHPALLHILRNILPTSQHRQNDVELRQDLTGYYILDLACRQNDLGRAFHVRHTAPTQNPAVDGVLRALIRGDWCLYWKQRDKMDRYQRRLVQWSDERMRAHALDCVGASYLSVDRGYLELVTEQEDVVEDLAKRKPGWRLEGEAVVVRQIRKK